MSETPTLHLKPAPGLRIRFPGDAIRQLAAGGELVPVSPYWLRRLKDGDVIEIVAKTKGDK